MTDPADPADTDDPADPTIPAAPPAAPPVEPTFEPTARPPRHPFPAALMAAIGLYVATWPLGFIAWFAGEPRHLSGEDEMAILVLSCVALPLLPIEIAALILACFGWRWAAIVYVSAAAVGLAASIPVYTLVGFNAFDVLTLAVWIGSALCLLAPGARSYYRWSDAYRRGRAGA